MGTQGEHSVIHRKAQVARDEFDAREMSPAKALRLSLAKAADRLFDLALTVGTVEQTVMPQSAIEAEIGDEGLLVLLDGQGGARGALSLDIQFLAALIEVQLMGQVRPGEAAPRPVTRTDAAIAAPLIDALLDGFDQNQQEAEADHVPGGFRFGDLMEDARALSLALGAPDYDLYRLTADLGPRAKTGVLNLILPRRPVAEDPIGKDMGGGLAARLEQNAMNAPVTLDAVLGRMSLPLDRICAWQPGTVLPLNPDALAETQMVGAKGHVVARVKLGQLNGFRAVRLLLPEAPPANPPAGGPGVAPKVQVIDHVAESPAVRPAPAPDLQEPANMMDEAGFPDDAAALLPQMLGGGLALSAGTAPETGPGQDGDET